MTELKNKIKNIGIIAHVDHGKTTLVDAILRQSGIFRENENMEERVMDSDTLEKEKGITIFSKNAAFRYRGYKINIVDTPGHADFGGEVQRILKMVDAVLLVVDAFEGPMPQTKYVLKKSLKLGHKVIVVINKIDRKKSRPHEVLDHTFELFLELNAADEQLDFPVVYTSATEGTAKYEVEDDSDNMIPLLNTMVNNVPDTLGDPDKKFQFLVSAIEYNSYVGKIGTGKIHRGSVKEGDTIVLIKKNSAKVKFRVTKVYLYSGLEKIEVREAFAGDIASIAGTDEIDVGETVSDKEKPEPLPFIEIDPPTLSMEFLVNNSPFAGREGKYVTSRHLKERLYRELQSNVSIEIESMESTDRFIVKGRGELQLAVLIENMRREGYELQVSKPRVILKKIDGKKMEPVEHVTVDVPGKHTGTVIEQLNNRKGEMVNMSTGNDGYTRLEFHIPTRGLLGYRNEFITDTRGTGVLNRVFYEYGEFRQDLARTTKGALVAVKTGEARAYAMYKLKDRGEFFIKPGTMVYEGMIVGEANSEDDVLVNVCKAKKHTNVRAAGSDESIDLDPPKKFTLEQSLEYIDGDELLEITPENVRFRKKILNYKMRRRDKK